MRQLAQQCLSDVRHPLVAGGIGVAVGFGLGLLLPSLGVFISLGPLLMIVLCLLPCLAPLFLLRWLNGGKNTPIQRNPRAPGGSDQVAARPLADPRLDDAGF